MFITSIWRVTVSTVLGLKEVTLKICVMQSQTCMFLQNLCLLLKVSEGQNCSHQ